jgi:ABC-type amino acid transport substrate-binding protein
LIGFDIDMAQPLAREMNLKLEFFPFDFDTTAAQIEAHSLI